MSFRCADQHEPVRHSVNLNPSVSAIASTIFELTVDATMASLSKQCVKIAVSECPPEIRAGV